jgi:lantibiotic leader peptide-processing serine protease
VISPAPSAAIAGAVHAADRGADVINVSLAISLQRSCRADGEPRNVCAATLSALGRAASYARQRGALVVAAAGNNALDLDHARDLTVVPADLATVMASQPPRR